MFPSPIKKKYKTEMNRNGGRVIAAARVTARVEAEWDQLTEYTIPEKPATELQKYRLTAK